MPLYGVWISQPPSLSWTSLLAVLQNRRKIIIRHLCLFDVNVDDLVFTSIKLPRTVLETRLVKLKSQQRRQAKSQTFTIKLNNFATMPRGNFFDAISELQLQYINQL